jgi:asparagine synthase (glutamine-hydrolysing)
MCGIAGYVLRAARSRRAAALRDALRQMAHRGPDDEGLAFFDPPAGRVWNFVTEQSDPRAAGAARLAGDEAFPHRAAFGHRRFSIVGLDARGHQPIWSADGAVCASVNGEIYNYLELREELSELGYAFRSASDSEVLAVAYRAWGTECFGRFNGFYAVSLYDAERRRVLLARDRLGVAPLYVAETPEGVFWASEVAALRALAGEAHFTVRDQSVVDFVAWQRRDYHDSTFWNEIAALPSASFAWLDGERGLETTRYWSLPTQRAREADVDPDDAARRLRALLDDATRLRLRADVPAAVQISGGMDSSAVLALVANHAKRFSAFTVKFADPQHDEEPYARAVANRFRDQVDYHVFEPPDDDLLEHADAFVGRIGEPFHSPNLYTANQIWRRMADQGYRVNLYGAGGDEVLAGYVGDHFYPYLRYLARRHGPARALRELASLSERGPGFLGSDHLLRALRAVPGTQQIYRRLRAPWRASRDAFLAPAGAVARSGPSEQIETRMVELARDQLLNYWLRIDSQNSMSVPLELRTPYLDYRVVEFAFSLPLELLIRDGWMKWLLRVAMQDLLPPAITWRRVKGGFPFPIGPWLLRHESRLVAMIAGLDCPYLDPRVLASEWQTTARRDPNRMWALVSLALWWKRCIQGDRLAA